MERADTELTAASIFRLVGQMPVLALSPPCCETIFSDSGLGGGRQIIIGVQ